MVVRFGHLSLGALVYLRPNFHVSPDEGVITDGNGEAEFEATGTPEPMDLEIALHCGIVCGHSPAGRSSQKDACIVGPNEPSSVYSFELMELKE